jgi:predicted AAA+ superfamily ATPase
MKAQEIIGRLETIQKRLLVYRPEILRPFFKSIKPSGRAVILTGARGTGKTTFLLSRLGDGHILYFSADNPITSGYSLYDLMEAAFMQGYEGVFIDEVHYAAAWAKDLKAAYDAFPEKTIWASDSSSLALRGGIEDLSRRFLFMRLPLLSFREFVALTTGDEYPALNAFEAGDEAAKILKKTNVLKLFKDYLDHGFRPIFLENLSTYTQRIMAMIEKALSADIPFLVPQLSDNNLRFMNAVVGYLAVSKIPTLAVTSLSNQWGLGKEKLYHLLEAMESAGVVRILRIKSDQRVHTVGRKIFLYEPSVYAYFGGDLGTMREAFVAGTAMETGRKVFASMDEKRGDLIVDDRVIEVGGKTKAKKGADFVVRDDIDLPVGKAIPMWVWGFEY